ncbi:MAG: SRPBCC family protein [Deltaproteobacteria bacterium]|nr:SRPBCC family protein [Deltaproteobacteria bacterium]
MSLKIVVVPGRMVARLTGVFAAAVITWPALAPSQPLDLARSSEPADQGSFTPAELRQLRRGELVMRPTAVHRGDLDLVGGTSWQAIDAPADVVWETLLDTSRYARFLPSVTDARLLTDEGRRRVVWLRHDYAVIDASYCLVATLDPERRSASFRVDTSRPRAIRAGWGFFTVRPLGERRSVVSYGILTDMGSGLAAGLLAPTIRDWMLRVPETVKEYVERRR